MKLQKIMLDGGFTCPNRDGKVGRGGCTFCLCESFNPDYCRQYHSIVQQMEAGKAFFRGKYPDMKYLAYFQAYTSTYASLEELARKYDEALSVPDVVGLVVATRPDCVDGSVLQLLQDFRRRGYMVTIELGCETFYDRTLERINRGHSAACSLQAISLCRQYDIPVTVHLMLGLPGEIREDILHEADILNSLPVSSIKLHQLQILRGTHIAREWERCPQDFLSFDLHGYVRLVAEFASRLRPDIHIERFASSVPRELLLAPKFGVKPAVVEKMVKDLLNAPV